MKILFVLHTLTSGGAERVTTSLANHWASHGHEVAVATMGKGEDFYTLDNRVVRHRFDLSGSTKSAVGAVAGIARRVTALRRLLRAEKPDVAIAMMAFWSIELALAARGLPVRTIGSERIHPPRLPLGKAWEFMRRHLYRLLDGVVAQTDTSRIWIETNTSASNVWVIANPVASLPPGQPAEVLGLPSNAPLILAVGRLVRQKRFDRVIDALAAEPAALSEWHLAVVGEGPLLRDLSERAQLAGIANRVHFPGRTTQIQDWYRRADIFTLTSDFEGFPNVLLEAMASGLAVISTDCETGPADLIRSGENGFLVRPGDAGGFRAALTSLARSPTLRGVFGEAARVTASGYSENAIARRWEELFEARENAS
ncbi:MAG: glycosyltransferase family 4 protein [Croceibacterium sp.]